MRALNRHVFDIWVLVLSAVCLVLMLVASSDPVPNALSNTQLYSLLKQFSTGNQIVFTLAAGVLASVFMYYLVVRIPDRFRRRRIRENLKATYETCKEACTSVYLECIMQAYPATLPRQLDDMDRFREFFKEYSGDGQTKWDAVANGLTNDRLKELVVELEILMHEIHFTLVAVDVQDQHAFSFFKHLSQVLYRSKNWSTDYDSTKSLLRFLWSLHTGWSWDDDYVPTDPVADMIAEI